MKQKLFDDNDQDDLKNKVKKSAGDQFNINEDFAAKFNHNSRRTEIERLEQKHGGGDYDDEDSYDEEDEDSDADQLTRRFDKKFNDLILKIRSKDPKLNEIEGDYFSDRDYNDAEQKADKQSKTKKKTYKDVLRDDIVNKMDRKEGDESSSSSDESERVPKQKKETIREEEDRLKAEFKKKVKDFDGKDQQSSSDDDDFMIKKGKAFKESSAEDSDSDEKPKAKKDKKELNMQTDTDILNQLYGKDAKMDRNDRFLMDFIFNSKWKKGDDSDVDNYAKYQEKMSKAVDQEDEDRDSEMDKFEATYNFRFEDKNAAYLTTHARQAPEDSMRRVDDSRKVKRQEAKDRKEELK